MMGRSWSYRSLININLSIYCSAAGNDLIFSGERVELAKYRPQRHESIRTRNLVENAWWMFDAARKVVAGWSAAILNPSSWNTVTHVSSYVIIDRSTTLTWICYVLVFENAFSASCGHCTRNNLTIAREHRRDAGLLRYSESWMISLCYVVLWILRATESKLAPLSEYNPFGMYWWS